MSNQKKLFKEFINTPFPTWNDVEHLLKKLGYQKIDKKGSAVEFWNESKKSSILLHRPHPGNTIKTYTKKDIIEQIKKAGFFYESL
ncbi:MULTISPECIES: type II toxin-antitoxin system HicA family toxin [Methylomicrobium]|uniref:Putative periplasmic or secreted lipoprotein n=1 Tax=Methylomicrobium album BG8 TaxID=686340 RepID=H8GHE4_METAL|nr:MULTISPECIES: type II toxin-antitoxin system HicA family toxin [Methylomicrobium]EIC30096.1 putative periplasmic or secreted lipoprotein [Methylomicrobium album BG8]